MTLNNAEPGPESTAPDAPERVGGLLLVFCLVLIVWEPMQLALAVASALPALDVRGPVLGVLIVVRVLVVAFGMAAGLALWSQQGPALTMARASVAISALTDVFVYLTPYFPNNRMPGDSAIDAAAALAYWTAWFCYLQFSRRVRNTYG